MTETDNSEEDADDVIESIAVGIAFIGVGVVLIYFFPLYFQSRAPTRITGLLLMALGIAGTGSTLGDIDVWRIGFDDLGLGLGIGIIWGVIVNYTYPILWVNAIITPLLFFAIYGTTKGLSDIIYEISVERSQNHPRKLFARAFIGVVQISAVISAFIELIKMLPG